MSPTIAAIFFLLLSQCQAPHKCTPAEPCLFLSNKTQCDTPPLQKATSATSCRRRYHHFFSPHAAQRHAVADRQLRDAHARVLHQRRVERGQRRGRLVLLWVGVEHAAVEERVVDGDEPAGPHEPHAQLKVGRVRALVGVDEGQVERPRAALAQQRLERRQRGPQQRRHLAVDAGEAPVAPGDGHRGRVAVDGDELAATGAAAASPPPPLLLALLNLVLILLVLAVVVLIVVVGQRERDGERAVAGEDAHLQAAPRAQQLHQQRQQRALLRRDLHVAAAHRGRLGAQLRQEGVLAGVLQQVAVQRRRHRRLACRGGGGCGGRSSSSSSCRRAGVPCGVVGRRLVEAAAVVAAAAAARARGGAARRTLPRSVDAIRCFCCCCCCFSSSS